MSSIRQRLLAAEDEFLAALGDGDGALITFNDRWEQLLADVDTALETTGLDSETASLTHTVTLRLVTLADTSAEIYSSCNDLTTQLMVQVDTLMSELTLLERPQIEIPKHPLSPSSISPQPTACPRKGPGCSTSSRKRRRNCPELEDINEERYKRSRPSGRATSAPLVSLDQHQPPADQSYTPSSAPPPVSSTKRKRCASDADFTCPTRPKRQHVGPRLHAVSMPIGLQERVEPWFNSIKAHVEAHVTPQAPLDPLELQPLNMFSGPLSADPQWESSNNWLDFWSSPMHSPSTSGDLDDLFSTLLDPNALPTPTPFPSESATDGHLLDALSFTSDEQPSPISSTSTPPYPLTPVLDADFELPPPRYVNLLPISATVDDGVADISWGRPFYIDGGDSFAFEPCAPPSYCAQDSTVTVDGQTDFLSAFLQLAPLADKDCRAIDSEVVVASKPVCEVTSAYPPQGVIV